MTERTNQRWGVRFAPKDEINTVQVVREDGSTVARGITVAAYAEIMVQEHNRAIYAEAEVRRLQSARDHQLRTLRRWSKLIVARKNRSDPVSTTTSSSEGDAPAYAPAPKTEIDLSGPTNQALLEAGYWERQAHAAEDEVRELRARAAALIDAIEQAHGPLDGTVRHGGQKVDGLRCDEPFPVRVAMRRLDAVSGRVAGGPA